MLADDEPDILESTRMVLEMIGHDVLTVAQAPDILPAILAHRPEILLQDAVMPGLDLARTVAAIHALPESQRPRILIFTASADGEEVCRLVGADGFLHKPFDGSRIGDILRAHTRSAPAREVIP